jgi:hypothetical protein
MIAVMGVVLITRQNIAAVPVYSVITATAAVTARHVLMMKRNTAVIMEPEKPVILAQAAAKEHRERPAAMMH